MGHAVYTLSDPREVILKDFARKLAEEKGMQEEFALYDRVEKIAKDLIPRQRQMFKAVCANVDFYSGFVYTMLGIPEELFTPFFAIARMPGWSAHRLIFMLVYKQSLVLFYSDRADDMQKGGWKTCLKAISIFLRLIPESVY